MCYRIFKEIKGVKFVKWKVMRIYCSYFKYYSSCFIDIGKKSSF